MTVAQTKAKRRFMKLDRRYRRRDLETASLKEQRRREREKERIARSAKVKTKSEKKAK